MSNSRTGVHHEHAVAAFVAHELGCEVTWVVPLDAFPTNAVYEVDANGDRLIVKASTNHDALLARAARRGMGLYPGSGRGLRRPGRPGSCVSATART